MAKDVSILRKVKAKAFQKASVTARWSPVLTTESGDGKINADPVTKDAIHQITKRKKIELIYAIIFILIFINSKSFYLEVFRQLILDHYQKKS